MRHPHTTVVTVRTDWMSVTTHWLTVSTSVCGSTSVQTRTMLSSMATQSKAHRHDMVFTTRILHCLMSKSMVTPSMPTIRSTCVVHESGLSRTTTSLESVMPLTRVSMRSTVTVTFQVTPAPMLMVVSHSAVSAAVTMFTSMVTRLDSLQVVYQPVQSVST